MIDREECSVGRIVLSTSILTKKTKKAELFDKKQQYLNSVARKNGNLLIKK